MAKTQPDTPGQRLEALLKERKVPKKHLGELLQLRQAYRVVHNWTMDMGFNARNQREVALLFKLPEDYFTAAPGEAKAPVPTRAAVPIEPVPQSEPIAHETYPSLSEFLDEHGHDVDDDERLFLDSQRFAIGDPGSLWWPKMLLEYRRMVHLRKAARAAREAKATADREEVAPGYIRADRLTAEELSRLTGEPIRKVPNGRMVGQRFFPDPAKAE